jgi:hypothetical protein
VSYDPHPPTGGGGSVTDATISTSDITTNNASATKHGWLIKLANTATKFLRDDGTWQTIAGGGDALVANPLSQFAATTSLQLKGVISDETGSGALVFATSPTLVTPVLGAATATSVNKVAVTAPATSATLTIQDGFTLTATGNASISGTHTGTSSGTNTGDVANTALTTGSLAQFASTTSAELRTLLSDETGTGAAVFATSPTLVTPTLGVASATTVNKVTVTAPATGSTLTIQDGFTLTVSGNATVSGTHTGSSSGTNTGDVANTAVTTGKLSQFAATSSSELAGVISDETGSGALVFATSPTLVTPTLGVASATSVALGNGNVTAAKQVCFNGVVAGGNKTGAAQNLADWTAGSLCLITLTGNCTGTSTMTSPTGVSRLTLMINTGGFTISTWPATVKWSGGAAPTLTSSGLDIITFIWDGSAYYGAISKGFA